MSTDTSVYSVLLPDRPIAFNRDFVRLGIGVTGALFLSQAVYWSKRADQKDGWFYKTADEWEAETGLTRREQETARKRIKALGVISEKKKGVPCKVWFKVDAKQIVSMLLSSMAESAKLVAQDSQPSMAESAKLDCTNAPYSDGGKRQTITENTQRLPETTAENGSPSGDQSLDFQSIPISSTKTIPKPKADDPVFEQAFAAYPQREGSNPKNKALECWRARLAEGVSPEAMLAGVQRYAAFVAAKGDLGTGFVMQARRFFGTSREFENDWTIAAPRAPQRADGRIGYVDSGFDRMNYGETEIPDWARD